MAGAAPGSLVEVAPRRPVTGIEESAAVWLAVADIVVDEAVALGFLGSWAPQGWLALQSMSRESFMGGYTGHLPAVVAAGVVTVAVVDAFDDPLSADVVWES